MKDINLNINFKPKRERKIVEYGDCIISGQDVYAMIQVDGNNLRLISLQDFNRKNDAHPNLYGETIQNVLKLFNDDTAIYVKRDEYKLTFTNNN